MRPNSRSMMGPIRWAWGICGGPRTETAMRPASATVFTWKRVDERVGGRGDEAITDLS